jgi:hypothetical protein
VSDAAPNPIGAASAPDPAGRVPDAASVGGCVTDVSSLQTGGAGNGAASFAGNPIGKPLDPAEHTRRMRFYETGKRLGWTQERMAAEAGVTNSTFQRWLGACGISARSFKPPAPAKSHPKPMPTVERIRACMTCSEPFPSTGAHHRLCSVCNGRAQNLSPLERP